MIKLSLSSAREQLAALRDQIHDGQPATLAAFVITGQTPMDVYAPLRAVAAFGGILLMGVGLDKMTLRHLAEEQAGRRLFWHWANGADGMPCKAVVGGDSSGFPNLEPVLGPLASERLVGQSCWRVFPA